MITLSLTCMLFFSFLGVCGMLGYVLSAYQRLLAERDQLKGERDNRQSEK